MQSSTVRLRSDQVEWFQAIMNKTDKFVIIQSPAGTGKSIAPMLMPMIDSMGLATLITPFISLEDDIKQRLIHHKVQNWHVYNNKQPLNASHQYCGLLLVRADQIHETGFMTFLNMQSQKTVLFIDEVHTSIFDGLTYRKKLTVLSTIFPFFKKVVLLSATLPNDCIMPLCRMFGLQDPLILRTEPKKRTNLELRVNQIIYRR
jgi:superfamily II DNA helicase RecQ